MFSLNFEVTGNAVISSRWSLKVCIFAYCSCGCYIAKNKTIWTQSVH